jgi:hypothetical protein
MHQLLIASSMPSFFLVSTTATAHFLVSLLLYFIVCRWYSTLLQGSSFAFVVKSKGNVMRHLRYLNWLPIRLRIDFKQALPIAACVDAVTILCPPRCSNSSAPLYLSSLLHVYIPRQNFRAAMLRPANSIPPFRTINHSDRAFSHSCSLVWNCLLQCHFCILSFHFPFPSQEAYVRSQLPKAKFFYVYLQNSNIFQRNLIQSLIYVKCAL